MFAIPPRYRRKVVAVTGASAGVGRATVREFARRGYDIGLIARNTDRLHNTAQEVEAAGGRACVAPADVADPAAVDAAAQRIEHELGPIAVWVNNAMATVFAPFDAVSADEFRRATEVTYLGTVYGTMAALACMRGRNRGSIVQVGSALAYRAIPLQSAYCGAKFAIRGFTDSLRVELRHQQSRIHITMIQLPAMNTPQFDWALNRMPQRPRPVPPVFAPEVAARAIYFAAHAKRREIFVGRSSYQAIFANRLVPRLLDRYLAKRGYSTQLRGVPAEEHRSNNLFEPIRGQQDVAGSFSDEERPTSWLLWLNRHRGPTLAASVALGALALITRDRAA